MRKSKPVSEYMRMLAYTDDESSRYSGQLFANEKHRGLIATDGKRMLCDRSKYLTTLVLDSKCFLYSADIDGILPAPKLDSPNFDSIIPSQEILNSEYRCISLKLPDWLKHISIRAKDPIIGFTLEGPIEMLYAPCERPAVFFNVHYFKDFIGQHIRLYFRESHAAVVMPVDQDIETTPWFALVMPRRSGNCIASVLLEPQKIKNEPKGG